MQDSVKNCTNCGKSMEKSDAYCSSCGQEETAKLLTVSELVSNLISSIYNLDNTIFRTLRYIFQPWKLTHFYVIGRRKDFLNPMRLFLVTLFLHFGLLVSFSKLDHSIFSQSAQQAKLEQSNLLKKYTEQKDCLGIDTSSQVALDSMQKFLFKDVVLPEQDTFFPSVFFFGRKLGITNNDAMNLPIDSLFLKYNITSYKEKLILQQTIKVNFDRDGMVNYGIGNAAWGIFLLVFVLALFMKLLYFRQHRHYVAHLVFNLNLHSTVFLMVSILFLIFHWVEISESTEETASGLVITLIPIFTWYSLYKNYQQSIVKTTLKFFAWSFFYICFGILLISVVSLISLLLF